MVGRTLSSWILKSCVEPVLRVGIILPEDRIDTIDLIIPDHPYCIAKEQAQGQSIRSCTAKISIERGQVVCRTGTTTIGPINKIALAPKESYPLRRAEGVRLQGVIAGRGFHWEKRIQPTFSGVIEFSVDSQHLLAVNELPLEHYLSGVIAGEMSGQCPAEFLKSQCIVARSWILAHTEDKHPDMPFDCCNDDCCQRYHGTTDLTEEVQVAVHATCGQVLIDHLGKLVDANYSKSCGGITESPENVWNVSKPGQHVKVDAPHNTDAHRFYPLTEDNLDEYLTGDWLEQTDIYCSPYTVPPEQLSEYLGKVDETGDYFRWRVQYKREVLEGILNSKYFNRQESGKTTPLHTLLDISITSRGESGRATRMKITYLDNEGKEHHASIKSEYAIRNALHEKFLYSSAFQIRIERAETYVPSLITLTGAGWGHGAGLCQIGALGMALKGYDYESIIKHYFQNVTIHKCY